MSYVTVLQGDGYKVVEIVRLPSECDINFVLEIRDALLKEDGVETVFIKFSGELTRIDVLDILKCKMFHDNLRRVLIRCLFEDKFYIGVVDRDIRDLELEVLLALDYIRYVDDVRVSFTNGYIPLSSGVTYSIFRGGVNLLNMLYNSPKISDLILKGYLKGEQIDRIEDYRPIDFTSGIRFKKLYRELFLRMSQFIGEIESNMHYRIG